jgi:hypothetical protein
LQIKVRDSQFVIWKATASQYPMPLVIVAYDRETYRMSEKLMRRPPLGEGDLDARVRAVHEDGRNYAFDREPPPALWRGHAGPHLFRQHGLGAPLP